MRCVICGHDREFAAYRFDSFTVRCCASCGHGVLDPIPADLEGLYTSKYFADHFKLTAPADGKRFKRRIAQEDHRVRSVRRFVSAGNLLDVGCGPGYFLYASKKVSR